ncbi:MAG: hypothetical protein OEW60_05780 [Thiovulaceae bacterium]|nr:hypothetical protein [Sulfurimonadaceae bacterium]
MKTNVMAMLLSALGMMMLAGVWHEVIMLKFYAKETGASHEGTAIIFLSYLILSFLMVVLYNQRKSYAQKLRDGIYFGALMGVLWVFPHELAMAGAHGESLSYVLINGVWHVVEQALGGFIIAFIFSRDKMSYA